MPPPPQKGGFPSWVIFIAVVLAVSFSVKMVIESVSRAPARVVETTAEAARVAAVRAANAIKEVFQVEPQIQVQSKVIQLQSSPILELALIERDYYITREWAGRHVIKGIPITGEKSVKVSGTFRAKAGFDLEKQFSISVSEMDKKINVHLPTAELLSVSIADDLALETKSGFLNKVKDETRASAINDFRRDAEAHAVASDLLSQAQKEAEQRLREALPDGEWDVVICFSSEEED